MNPNIMECDDHKLKLLLAADEHTVEHDPWMQHVEHCSHCQSRLRELAAQADDWQKAAEVLAADDDDVPYFGRDHDAPSSWNESLVKQLLEPPSHPEMLGRLGRYDMERMIGCGGMGIVFKAFDTELNRVVAVKLLAPYLAARGSARKRFAREARAAAGVRDDHVVPIFNVESEHEPPFLVMQYVAGGSLQEKLDRDGTLEVAEVLRIGLQTAKGLAAAHAQGLIHRDVKPSNILLDEGVERALLTDFGLARAEDDACLTRSGFHPGTPHYMSPEQVRGEAIDGRSDLFSLGCVLYALSTGHSPFRAETSYAVMRRITDESPRLIREQNANIPEWLEAIVMKLLWKSREDRFASAKEVAELLEDCLAHVHQPATTPLPARVQDLAAQSVSASTESLSASRLTARHQRIPPIGKFIAAAAGACALLFAGVLIVLELRKGTLTIESELDNVPICIMQGDKVVEKMTVSKSGNSVRVAAGMYVVELDAKLDGMIVENDQVSLKRGATELVKIHYAKRVFNARDGSSAFRFEKPEALQGEWEFISVESDGVITEYKTPRLRLTVAADVWTVQGTIGGGGHRVEIDGNKLTFHGMTTMPGLSSNEEPTIGYGLWQVDGDTLIYLMTPAVAESALNGQSKPPIEYPDSFATKGTENNVFRLRRIQASTAPTPSSSTNQTQSKSSPEYPSVKIVVRDEEGKPLEGVKVSLIQLAKDPGGQVLEINETSNASGLAVNRNLPYGHYELTATTADGWYLTGYRSRLNVEFEKGVDAILVAPTPGKTSKLVISSGITTSPKKISGLRFGGLTEGNRTDYAPEPEGSDSFKEKEFSSFPTITNGIEYIGAEIRLEIWRNISQPAPSMQQMNTSWRWSRPPNSNVSFRYLIANGQARSFNEGYTPQNESPKRLPVEGSEFFKLPGPNYRVGAELLKLREPTQLPLELDIPAGNVRVKIGRFLGKPSAAVMAALNWQPQEQQPELWLQAYIAPDSAWVERLMNMDWINSPFRSGGSVGFTALWREQALRPGERLEIPLGIKHDQKTLSASAAHTLDDITSVYNEQTRQLRTELFTPPIPDLTTDQMRAAMLAAAEQYRKQGRVEVSSSLKTSAETNRLSDRLTFMGMCGTMSDGFRQITPQFNFEAASNSALMVVLGKAELRYSRNGWSSKTWGDIHPPITGKWELVSVEQRGETLTQTAYDQWRKAHESWTELTIDATELTMIGNNAAKLDFSVDYDAGLLPQYAIRQDGNTKYSGVLMGNGFIDDNQLLVAVDLEGSSMPQTFHTTDGKTTKLTYRRMPAKPQTEQVVDALVTFEFSGVVGNATLSTSGIGWIIDKLGHILVPTEIAPRSEEYAIEVRYADGSRTSAKRVFTFGHLALLKPEKAQAIPPIRLRSQKLVQDGDQVLAILNGTDIQKGTVTDAKKTIVSLDSWPIRYSPPLRFPNAIETDFKSDTATLFGAPLLTPSGELVGMLLNYAPPLFAIPLSEIQIAYREFESSQKQSPENAVEVTHGTTSETSTIEEKAKIYSDALPNPDSETIQGEWQLAHVFHHPTLTSDSSCVIGKSSLVVGQKADQPPHKFIYTLRGQSEIDLRPSISEGLGAPQLGRYQFKDNRLYIAFNQDPNTKDRPVYATMEDPSKGVTLLILERVGNAEIAAMPSPSVASESKAPAVDHLDARSVVETYVASALAGDVAKAASLAKNSPADPKHIRELPEFLNVQRLKIETVYVNDPAKPTQALATSVAVKLGEEHKNPDGRRDGFMVFALEFTDEKWFVIDIDFETESGAEKELNKFLKANPNSIGIPPQS